MLFRLKYPAMYALLIGVAASLMMAALYSKSAGNWLITAGLLLDLAGLLQLEISGVFSAIMAALMKASDAGLAPSHLVREVIDNPDEAEWRKRLRWWLFSGPKTGITMIGTGILFQLAGTWLQGS